MPASLAARPVAAASPALPLPRVHDNRAVAELLHSHLSLQAEAAARHHAVREYNEAG
jgi:hypothetical protein